MTPLYFVKLGGSLITDKQREATARPALIRQLADMVHQARQARPELRLLLGHGSGSFGHWEAQRYHTRNGVAGAEAWVGFARVGAAAARLNRLVADTFIHAGVPVMSLPPSTAAITEAGQVVSYGLEPLQRALEANLVPLVFGDVVFDRVRGGGILSTEDVFVYLAQALRPQAIFLLGNAPGVLDQQGRVIAEITPARFAEIETCLGGSAGVDVTGGMRDKVLTMLHLIQARPDLHVWILSGRAPGSLFRALMGDVAEGTHLHAD